MYFLRIYQQGKILKISIFSILCASLIVLVATSISTIKTNKAAADTIEELMQQVTQAEQLYDKALSEQYAAEAKYNEAEETIRYAEQRIPELQYQIGQRAKELYINRANGLLLMLLNSSSLSDIITILDYINKINQKDAALIAECAQLKAQAQDAEAQIRLSIDASIASADEAASILASVQYAIEALQAQNIPVVPDPGGGGGGGGDDPGPGPGPEPGPMPYGDDIVTRAYSCIGLPYG